MNTTKAWYIRRFPELEVVGLFPSGQISQEILLGRYSGTDEVSHDKIEWLKIQDVKDFTDEIVSVSSDDPKMKEQLLSARRWADERRDVARKKEKKSGIAFRNENEDIKRLNTLINKGKKKTSLFSSLILLSFFLSFIFLAFKYSPEEQLSADCFAPAMKGVDWHNCNLEAANLSQVNLMSANLMGADLQQADLQGADLSFANLKYAKLNSANLQQVNFTQADLKGANLFAANLSSARLNNADLSYVDFRSAIIIGAHFDGVKLDNAIWVDGRICSKGSIGQCN